MKLILLKIYIAVTERAIWLFEYIQNMNKINSASLMLTNSNSTVTIRKVM